MHPAPRRCLPLALLLTLCTVHAEDATPAGILAASSKKPVERSIPAAVPQKPPEKPEPKAHEKPPEKPAAPVAAVTGTTSLAAPDDERPLQYVAPNKKHVSKGELLVLFENGSLYEELDEARKELKACKAATSAAEAQAITLEAAAGEKIATATFELKKAEKTLSKYIEGDAPAAEIALNLALADAEANFSQQTERYNVRDKMLAEGYIHKMEYENEERLLEKMRLLRDAAKLKLNAFLKYDREQTIDQLTRNVNDKKTALEKIQKEQEEAIAKAQRAIEACGKAETVKTRECDELVKKIQATIILAPREGTFAYHEGIKFVIGTPITRGRLLGTVEK